MPVAHTHAPSARYFLSKPSALNTGFAAFQFESSSARTLDATSIACVSYTNAYVVIRLVLAVCMVRMYPLNLYGNISSDVLDIQHVNCIYKLVSIYQKNASVKQWMYSKVLWTYVMDGDRLWLHLSYVLTVYQVESAFACMLNATFMACTSCTKYIQHQVCIEAM